MLRLFILLSLFTSSFVALNSQEISIGYLGNNLWNPGVTAQYDFSHKAINHSISINSFLDPGSHVAIFSSYGLKFKKGCWLWQIDPAGLYRSFLFNTYTVGTNGEISKPSSFKGNFYYAPSISTGLTIKNLTFKLQVMLLTPYNNSVMPLLNTLVSYRFQLKNQNQQ